jgi:hypothetical protein
LNEELSNEITELRKELADSWGEISSLRREKYQLMLQLKQYRKEWLQLLGANINLANIIKSFDSEYFEKIGGADEEGKSDYKGMQVQNKQNTE